jgi:hypothetical protein
MILDFITIASITIIITTSKLFKPLREFLTTKSVFVGKLLSCSLCTGVWVGLAFCFVPEYVKSALYYIFIGSLSSELIYLLIERLKLK